VRAAGHFRLRTDAGNPKGNPSMSVFVRSLVVSGALLVVAAPIASAHVTVKPDTTAAGAYAALTVTVPHGCDGSSTTRVAIQIPESIPQITPSISANWDVTKVMSPLSAPVDVGHGKQVTERVSEVVYTAKGPLPEGYRDSFTLGVKFPEKAGDTLTFPVIQTCEVGETAWIEVPAEGQNADELERPASQITLTAAESDGGETEAAGEDTGTRDIAFVALALGAIGAALGLFAAIRSRKE
jgi:uncharacterized protein YcnI